MASIPVCNSVCNILFVALHPSSNDMLQVVEIPKSSDASSSLLGCGRPPGRPPLAGALRKPATHDSSLACFFSAIVFSLALLLTSHVVELGISLAFVFSFARRFDTVLDPAQKFR